VVASFLVDTFLGFAILGLLAAAIQAASRVPPGYLLRGSALFLGFLLFILAFQVLFYAGEVPEGGYLWRWGILSVSTAGLESAAILG
ncbi:hypothetical protein OFO30_35225, partial [Escherichia coli]|nr:hypothetical protein [Escherichia coli]